MIKTYFKIAIRNLWRSKWLSFINITGLAIGIATCLIIMLYVYNELSYDRYNEDADRMARVYFKGNVQGQKMKEAVVMAPVAQALKNEFPEVESATRIREYGTPKLKYGNQTFKNDQFAFVDSNFFEVFTIPLVEGDARTVLLEPNTVVITQKIAGKYFGKENPVGKIISFHDGKNEALKVTGVIKEVPANSHFRFELFASMASIPDSRDANWMSSNYFTYLVLRNKSDFDKLETKLLGIVDKYIGPQMKDGTGMTLAEFRKKGNNIGFHLQHLTDIHLNSDFGYTLGPSGDIRNVYIFSAIAIFMLLIACINFMNLATAGAARRSREVGIRKVMGSSRTGLIKQFLVESILIASLSLILAMVLMHIGLPLFNQIADQNLAFDFSSHPLLVPGLIAFIIGTGILAGSYPAFYLSSFKPVLVLKGKFTSGKRNISLRQALVVFQFVISIILIISTTVVYRQLSYMNHKDLGYKKEQVVILSNTWMLGKNQAAFSEMVSNDSRVASVSGSRYLPAGNSDNNNFFISPGSTATQMIKTLRYEVDENYINTLGIQLIAGRNFSKDFGTDSNAVILNEASLHALGWNTGNAIGQTISRTSKRGEQDIFHVIGVVKDFHFRSLHESISPLVMVLAPDPGNLIVKLKSTDVAGFTSAMQKGWTTFGTDEPLSYSFLDERFYNTYKAEQKIGLIMAIFAGLTIFVACLGLFGLTKFTAQQRTKEIGVRKVLGASVTQISTMLSKEFLKLVLIACAIAFPLSWWAMSTWLKDFAYRIHISWVVFVFAAVAAISIAIITVSFQAIKAAIANPVKSLRTE
jgi:putative ABC transport system permease protein